MVLGAMEVGRELFVSSKKRKQTTRCFEGILKWRFFITKLPCERENSTGVVFKQIKQPLSPGRPPYGPPLSSSEMGGHDSRDVPPEEQRGDFPGEHWDAVMGLRLRFASLRPPQTFQARSIVPLQALASEVSIVKVQKNMRQGRFRLIAVRYYYSTCVLNIQTRDFLKNEAGIKRTLDLRG